MNAGKVERLAEVTTAMTTSFVNARLISGLRPSAPTMHDRRATLRPSSVAAWAGRRCFDETGDITKVAQLLGVRSLDQAARIIGWDWTT